MFIKTLYFVLMKIYSKLNYFLKYIGEPFEKQIPQFNKFLPILPNV